MDWLVTYECRNKLTEVLREAQMTCEGNPSELERKVKREFAKTSMAETCVFVRVVKMKPAANEIATRQAAMETELEVSARKFAKPRAKAKVKAEADPARKLKSTALKYKKQRQLKTAVEPPLPVSSVEPIKVPTWAKELAAPVKASEVSSRLSSLCVEAVMHNDNLVYRAKLQTPAGIEFSSIGVSTAEAIGNVLLMHGEKLKHILSLQIRPMSMR